MTIDIDPDDQRNRHEGFVRDAIARSLLTLPFAHLDAKNTSSEIFGYYGKLLGSSTSGELPSAGLLARVVELVQQDAAIHEEAGNYLKAYIERQWCEGLLLHFTWGQTLKTPEPVKIALCIDPSVPPAARKAIQGVWDRTVGAVQPPSASPNIDQVITWCESHDQHPTEGWLCQLLDGSLTVDDLRMAILEDRDPHGGWSAKTSADAAETTRLVTEMEALPAYRGWSFSYEYPGYFCYSRPDNTYSVAFTPDWEGDEVLPIQVSDDDGHCYAEHSVILPLPREGRTAQKIFEMVRPTLDKLLQGAAS